MQRQLIIGNQNYSSWSLRAWLALRKSGVDFETVKIRLSVPDTHERILRYSPAGRVPVLHDGEVVLWDSLAICEYLAENYAPSLWPADKAARALARSVSAEMHSGFAALREALPMNCRATGREVVPTAEVQRDIARILAVWDDCRRRFGAAGGWLFGDFSIADAMYAPVVFRFATYGVAVAEIGRGYMTHVLNDEDVREWQASATAEPDRIDEEEVGF